MLDSRSRSKDVFVIYPHSFQALTIGEACSLACSLEVTAPKAGNVYPGVAFSDLQTSDFLAAASVCASVLQTADSESIGSLILQIVERSRRVTQSNANLGIALLLSPLAKAAFQLTSARKDEHLQSQVAEVLAGITSEDGVQVYEAIRIATAGGLGAVDDADVNNAVETVDLQAAMQQARHRDRIAELYVTDFHFLFDVVVPTLTDAISRENDWLRGITLAQIVLLSDHIDTLIARKCGLEVAEEARERALRCRNAQGYHVESEAWISLDQWLREDGNRRNPGTTADLIAAALFVVIYCDR